MPSLDSQVPVADAPAQSAAQQLAASVRSMTGYALVRAETTAGELTVSLRSVNHRGLDLHFHVIPQLAPFENAVRALLKQHIGRGHVEIRMTLAPNAESGNVAYNRDLLAHYVGLFRQASQDFGIDSKPDLNALLALPGVFDAARESKTLDNTLEPEIIAALAACVAELNAYREAEGRELCAVLEFEIAAMERQATQMGVIRTEAVSHFLGRLRERVSDLLQDAVISEARLLEEAAVLADKSDIQEELARLVVHTRELRRIFASGGEIGKRLDFLLQEMNRETNTILSKTFGIGEAGLTITNLALATKANIERMREQALNLE